MGSPWISNIKSAGKLKVFVRKGGWDSVIKKSITTFNNLGLGVKLERVKTEDEAEIVVSLSPPGNTVEWKGNANLQGITLSAPKFGENAVHGMARTVFTNANEIAFAAVFLPSTNKSLTVGQKEVITVHEFIHAAGMIEHDSEGIMYDIMNKTSNGLIEGNVRDYKKSMPPIRVGGTTKTTVSGLWANP